MKENVDIILPCYNPPIGWERIVISKYKKLRSLWPELIFHLYVVNDGTKLGFSEESIAYLVTNVPDVHILSYISNQGKGFALRVGVAKCTSEYILYTDWDFPYTIDSMCKVMTLLLQGEDVVVPIRGNDYYSRIPFFRSCISKCFYWCNRHVFRMEHYDTQTGLKGFNRCGRSVFLSTKIKTYLFDWEFVFRCCRIYDLKVKSIDVELREDVFLPNFKLRIYWDELKNLKSFLLDRSNPRSN